MPYHLESDGWKNTKNFVEKHRNLMRATDTKKTFHEVQHINRIPLKILNALTEFL